MKLSEMKNGEAGVFLENKGYPGINGERFVVERTSHPRATYKIASIMLEEGVRLTFLLDKHDPEVKVTGKGQIVERVIFDH